MTTFQDTKTLEAMTLEEKVDWATGNLVIAIGKGEFRSAVTHVLLTIMQEAYNRGNKEARSRS